MREVNIITNKMNHLIDPVLSIWGWQVPVYLFLGGMSAGVLIIASVLVLFDRHKSYRWAGQGLLFLSPILISLGMGALFLDLEKKIHVWRFYTAFRPTSPMSWGAWILLIIYPLNFALILGNIREFFPQLHQKLLEMTRHSFFDYQSTAHWCERKIKTIAAITLPFSIGLGIYTGILLSAYVARPFWNVSILGPLFLVSGISTALALVMLFTKDLKEYEYFAKLDILVIITEFIFLLLFGYNMFTSTQAQQNAIGLITGGPLTASFWVFFVGFGLTLPLFIELAEQIGLHFHRKLAPLLILFGGLMFRLIVVEAGQITSWVSNFRN